MGAALCVAATPVWSHRVNVFAYAEADSVRTESYFADGRKCSSATVSLLDASGQSLASAPTDDQGLACLPVPRLPPEERSDLRVVLEASMGHRAEYALAASEIWPGSVPGITRSDEAGPGASSASMGATATGIGESSASMGATATGTGESSASMGATATGIGASSASVGATATGTRETLGQQLALLTQAVRDLQREHQRASVRDVIGGVGYILGILGIYYYLKGRSP
jgi:nickel transport protein